MDGQSLAIVPLTPERFADVAMLFEQGGDPKWCWYKRQVGTIGSRNVNGCL